jgi:hypothetical protein
MFDITFFVVLVSATFQGWSLAPVARWLGLQHPPRPEPPVTLEITSLRHVEGDIVEYTVPADCYAAGRKLREIEFPENAVVALVAHDQQVIPPRGRTRIEVGDHVFIVLKPEAREQVDKIFSSFEEGRHAKKPGAEGEEGGTGSAGPDSRITGPGANDSKPDGESPGPSTNDSKPDGKNPGPGAKAVGPKAITTPIRGTVAGP